MRRTMFHRISYGSALVLIALMASGAGCTAGAASKTEKTPGVKSAPVKKLNPEEITKAGDTAARAGEYDRAINFYRQAIDVEPTADLWFRTAYIYNKLGKKPYAAQAFAQTIQLDPNHAAAHEELGLLMLENKQREKAAFYLEKATELDPQRWRAHNALGVLADASRDYASAASHYAAALAVVPDSPLVLSNLGYSHYLAGDLDEAEAVYRRVLTAEPGNRAVLANYGLLYARRGQYTESLDVMAGVMDLARAYNDVGYIAFQNGNLDEAERLLTEAIRLSPSYYALANENLARVRNARADAARTGPPQTPDAPVSPSPTPVARRTP